MKAHLWIQRILPLLVGSSLVVFAWHRTEGFEEEKIYCDAIFKEEPEDFLEEEKNFSSALLQPFFYLGKGKQSYVFESSDGKYVIKFFHFSSNHRPSFLSAYRLPWFVEKICSRKEKRGKAFFRGYLLDDHLRDLVPKITATLFVKLTKGSSHKEIVLFDKWHQKHTIEQDRTAFVLQKKAAPFFPWLKESLAQEDLFRKRTSAYLDLLFSRLDHFLLDPDGRLLDHIGLVDGSLVFIDHGRIFFDPRLKEKGFLREKIANQTSHLRKFLLKNWPKGVEILDEEVARRLSLRRETS
jgi:hypothetical protein